MYGVERVLQRTLRGWCLHRRRMCGRRHRVHRRRVVLQRPLRWACRRHQKLHPPVGHVQIHR